MGDTKIEDSMPGQPKAEDNLAGTAIIGPKNMREAIGSVAPVIGFMAGMMDKNGDGRLSAQEQNNFGVNSVALMPNKQLPSANYINKLLQTTCKDKFGREQVIGNLLKGNQKINEFIEGVGKGEITGLDIEKGLKNIENTITEKATQLGVTLPKDFKLSDKADLVERLAGVVTTALPNGIESHTTEQFCNGIEARGKALETATKAIAK